MTSQPPDSEGRHGLFAEKTVLTPDPPSYVPPAQMQTSSSARPTSAAAIVFGVLSLGLAVGCLALFGQLKTTQNSLSSAQNQLAEKEKAVQLAKEEADSLRQSLASANKRADDEAKQVADMSRPLPTVTVQFFPDSASTGYYALITNTGGSSDSFTAHAERTGVNPLQWTFTLEPGKSEIINSTSGWVFSKGDKVTVDQKDHASERWSF